VPQPSPSILVVVLVADFAVGSALALPSSRGCGPVGVVLVEVVRFRGAGLASAQTHLAGSGRQGLTATSTWTGGATIPGNWLASPDPAFEDTNQERLVEGSLSCLWLQAHRARWLGSDNPRAGSPGFGA